MKTNDTPRGYFSYHKYLKSMNKPKGHFWAIDADTLPVFNDGDSLGIGIGNICSTNDGIVSRTGMISVEEWEVKHKPKRKKVKS